MKFHNLIFFAFIAIFATFISVSAQADSVIGQITNSASESFAGGISGDGRFVVFESFGNVATENPRNTDGNREIFLFDYAQRRIFQLTDTRSLRTNTAGTFVFNNIKVEISNLRPVISRDGRWIAFGSNATTSTPAVPNATNPGSFDAESFNVTANGTTTNPLTSDGNAEMWLYQIPATTPADLTSGDEIAFTDLTAGTFTRVTNTAPSRLPFPGSNTSGPIIGDDNRDATIGNDGNYIAFVSNRDLVPPGNASPNANDEIFSYVRNINQISQITQTERGSISTGQIYNATPTISGNGLRVTFLSSATNPVIGMTGGSNADRNVEVHYTDLNPNGTPVGTSAKQITTTTGTNTNRLDFGRRMSLDGRYIAFDSFADLQNENGGANYTSFAVYLYDTTLATNQFRRIGPRSDADTGAPGGDVSHYPGFTNVDANGSPATLVLETRQNIKPDGTIPAMASDGLNNDDARPTQIYALPLNVAPAAATYNRLTKFPVTTTILASTQPLTSDTLQRMTFNLALTEIGTGNPDLASEAFYFLLPTVSAQTPASLTFATGASLIPVSASPVPTPSPTATPTPTPTPSPSPSPSPSPTPVTPPAVQGVSPGMLAVLNFSTNIVRPIISKTGVGSINRRFSLPIQLSGVTMTINGAACGLKSVANRQIVFVVPPGLTGTTVYPVVVNNNGIEFKGNITVVPARPDIFNFNAGASPGGRARIFNATNRVLTTEPFTATTLKFRGGVRVATVLRVFLTGVNNIPRTAITIRLGGLTVPAAQISAPVLREPGVYSIDFTLGSTFNGLGDVPIVVTVTVDGVQYQSRLDDTAPRLRIL